MAKLGPLDPLEAQVAAGARWLDDRHPGWWDWVDETRLSMVSTCLCVGGQIEGHLTGDDFGGFCARHEIGRALNAEQLGLLPEWDERYAVRDMWRWEILARRQNPPRQRKQSWLTNFMRKFTRRDRDAEIW